MSGELARVERGEVMGVDALTPGQLIAQITLIQNVMSSVMKENEHYGKIPGCGDKPTLLKAGAEKLAFLFRHRPEFGVEVLDLFHPTIPGHREYRIVCDLYSITTGEKVGQGVGSASTMESKWRFRTGPVEPTGTPVPSGYWDVRKSDPAKAQAMLGGSGFGTKKIDGKWEIVRQGEKVENENPADVYNTVLKMGKKRAHVDAELTATAASDIFTQDVEELVENGVIQTAEKKTEEKPPVQPPQEKRAEGTADLEHISQKQGGLLFAKFKAKGVNTSGLMNEAVRGWYKDDSLELYKLPVIHFDDCVKRIDALPEPGK